MAFPHYDSQPFFLWIFFISHKAKLCYNKGVLLLSLVVLPVLKRGVCILSQPLLFYAPMLTISKFVKTSVTVNPAMYRTACRASLRCLLIFPFLLIVFSDVRLSKFIEISIFQPIFCIA